MNLENIHKQQPKIWCEFISKGKKFWIQNVEPEQTDFIVDTMCNDFLQDEPLGNYGRVLDDSTFVKQNRLSYYDTLSKGKCVVCMTNDEDNQPTIAGIHCQEIISYPPGKDEFRFGFSLLFHLLEFRNVCREMNVEKIFVDRGLFVFPKYRGNGIGTQLLKCWSRLCKEANMKLGLVLFSSKYSQDAATCAGLPELKYLSYEDARKTFPQDIPNGIEQHTDGLSLRYVLV